MRPSARRVAALGALGAALLVLVVAAARPAHADDAPPVPRPAPLVPAAEPTPKPTISESELDDRITASPAANVSQWVTKLAPAGIGLVLLVLAIRRGRARRRGELPPAPPLAHPPAPFGLGSAIGLVVAGVIGGGILVGVAYGVAYGRDALLAMPLWVMIASTAAGTVPVAILVAIRLRMLRARRAPGDAGDARMDTERAWRMALAAYCVATALLLVAQLGFVEILKALRYEPRAQDLVLRFAYPSHPSDRWLIGGFGVLVAPVTEEWIFRGLLYPALRDAMGRVGAVLVSSAVFSAIHGSLTAAPALFLLAVVLAELYERTGRMGPSVVVHVLNNATSLLPLFFLG